MKMLQEGPYGLWFPENPKECKRWESKVIYCALARRVLAVAHTRIEGTWRAYIDAVPGHCHERELGAVLDQGCKLPHKWALVLFPEFKDLPYAK